MKYGMCDCGKWGLAPIEFRETKHFMVCECGKDMYLTHLFEPVKSLGYREENRIEPKLRLHNSND